MVRNKKAFTLIEMMVIVAIIGMLATLIAVGTVKARNIAAGAKAMTAAELILSEATECLVGGTQDKVNPIAISGATIPSPNYICGTSGATYPTLSEDWLYQPYIQIASDTYYTCPMLCSGIAPTDPLSRICSTASSNCGITQFSLALSSKSQKQKYKVWCDTYGCYKSW